MPKKSQSQEESPAAEKVEQFTKAFAPKHLRIKKKSYGKKIKDEDKVAKYLIYRKYEYVNPIIQGTRTKRFKDIRLVIQGATEWNTKDEARNAKETYLREHEMEIEKTPEVEAEIKMTGEENDSPTSTTPN